jgi:8-oxo-dGTP pyrophosphatase MutT (NUDIX family)
VKSPRPRDAASLIALSRKRGEWRVLMGRRSTRTRFVPEVWVFPGGRVDREDRTRSILSPLEPTVERRLALRHDRPRALAVAALRETFEETGVAVGTVAEAGVLPDLARLDYVGRAITPAGQPIRYHARFFCLEWKGREPRLRGNGELEELDWWPVEEVLALPTVDVTDLMLEEALERVRSGAGSRRRPLFVHYRGLRPHVRREP